MPIDPSSSSASLASESPAARQALSVLEILPRLEVGGTARSAIDLSMALVRAGGRALIVSEGGRLLPEVLRGGITHETLRVDSESPWLMLKLAWHLGRLAGRDGIDIFHARSAPAAWATVKAQRFAKLPVIVTLHDCDMPTRRIHHWYADALRHADHVIAVSDFVAAEARNVLGIANDRLTVIPHGINLARFNPGAINADRLIKHAQKLLLPDGVPLIIMPASLLPEKGHALLIEALALLGARPFYCLMLGDDSQNDTYRQEIEELIVAKNLEGKVRFGGFCDDMPALYMLADLVVIPSLEPEAFALAAAEAQAMGRPVVAADHGSAPEIVRAPEAGWLFKPRDAAALSTAIAEGLSLGPAKRERIALAARAHIERHFTLETMCRRTFEVYARVLAAGQAETRRSA